MSEYLIMDGMDTEQHHYGKTFTLGTKRAAMDDGAKVRYKDVVTPTQSRLSYSIGKRLISHRIKTKSSHCL